MMENWERAFTKFIGAIKMATIYDLEQQAKTIEQQQEIIEKQKIIIDELLKAVRGYLNSIGTKREIDKLSDLKTIYTQASMEES